jgi:DNA polymerase I-like protein with 3'-5' exonuclease and polymerase domains
MAARIDDKNNFRYGLKYFGAHTGRDSGDGGFNVQNMPREAMHGVDLRSFIVAPEGYTFGIIDESAIEPRVLACLSGDEKLVELLNKGYDPYEAQARVTNQYTDPRPLKEVNPELRRYMKVDVLGMGYGAGPAKIQVIAKQQAGLELSLEEAEARVARFRARGFIPALWNYLEMNCRKAAPKHFRMPLPSGRELIYRDVKSFGSICAKIPRMGKMMEVRLWGGTLCENLTQAVARDIFMWHVMQIKEAGFPRLLRAHDEVVVLLAESTAEHDLYVIEQIMGTAPPWMPEFPAKAEGAISKHYKKI